MYVYVDTDITSPIPGEGTRSENEAQAGYQCTQIKFTSECISITGKIIRLISFQPLSFALRSIFRCFTGPRKAGEAGDEARRGDEGEDEGHQFNEKAQLEPYEGNYFRGWTPGANPKRNHKEIPRTSDMAGACGQFSICKLWATRRDYLNFSNYTLCAVLVYEDG